jgi:nicotinamide mononucleotide transporter
MTNPMDALLQPMQPLFAAAFTLWGAAFTWLEIVACAMAVAMVVLNMRVHPLAWPLAILSSLLYMALFWNSGLYGEGSLQVVFAVVAGWGWWQWLRGRTDDGSALRVRHLSRRGRWAVLLALAVAWPAVGLFLRHYTDSDVPWWDAFPTAASLIGQWLLGRKLVENWPTWVAVNAVSVMLFAQKGLWLTVGLYLVFFAMSFSGWQAWRRLAADARSPGRGTALVS